MLVIFNLLLILGVGRCTDDQIIDTETVDVGGHVKMTCIHERLSNLFWIRLVPGKVPEVLGRSFHNERIYHHIATTEETGTFVLRIRNAELSDTGVYYCMKLQQKVTFLKRADLKVEGPDPDITDVPSSDSMTLQCSVLTDSGNQTCPGRNRVCCFRAGSEESHPSFNYGQGNSVEEYEKNSEGLSNQKCFYSHFKNVSSSDAGTYYCAVARCGEIMTENRHKPDNEAVNMWELVKDNPISSLLCAALAISLIVIAILSHSIKKLKRKSCGCCTTAVALETNAAAASVNHQRRQIDEDSLVYYSAPTFTKKKLVKAVRRYANTEEAESIYTDVRALGFD